MNYHEFYRRSIAEPEAFWAEQAGAIHWHVPPQQILDDSNPPFRRWFVGGETNLCYNAVDRHLDARGEQRALVGVSTETDTIRELSYRELYREVNAFASVLVALGVGKGERVVIYMPHTLDAVIAMLACARIGAIHSTVFGGFAALNLALRIDDAKPKLLICADAGSRGRKIIPFKPLVDDALEQAQFPPEHVLIINRKLAAVKLHSGRDIEYAPLREQHLGREVPITWLESNEPSYLLYTSGTTGKPKGVQRDVGGYAVALTMSMWAIYDIQPGQVMFSTSDIGWVVGHSYNVYAPLLAGATSILHEGLPIEPDPGIWWSICDRYGVRTMFSSPTAIRVLKKQHPAWLKQYDLSKLQYLFLAGEPLDEPTAKWIAEGLNKTVIDNYWQTETGWPILALMPGVELKPIKFGSPGLPVPGYRVRVIDEATGEDAAPGQKGVLVIEPPLPPGCLSTIWGDDERFIDSYFSHFKQLLYSSLDWAIRAPMTSSTSPGIGWERAKLKNPSPATRAWPKRRWLACMMRSKARFRSCSLPSNRPQTGRKPPPLPANCNRPSPASWARWRARRGCMWSARCPKRARANSCGARCRRWPNTVTLAICPPWMTPMRWKKCVAYWDTIRFKWLRLI